MYETPQKILNKIGEKNAAALVSSCVNRRYVSGIYCDAGLIFITDDNAYFLIDSRYYYDFKRKNTNFEVLLSNSHVKTIAKLCRKHSIEKIFVEYDEFTMKELRELTDNLSVEIVSDSVLSDTLKKLRVIKTEFEINKIASSQQLTDETFKHLLSFIKVGTTEQEIALEAEVFMRKEGAERVAFDFIVASGENSSSPHGIPSGRVIKRGDLVTIDMGAVFEGFCSDMTRTIAVGSIDRRKESVYNAVLKAQNDAIDKVKAGVSCKSVDKAARDALKKFELDEFFCHSTGHGVGLNIHEAPYISQKSAEILEPGMVITIEPGVYINKEEENFGIRIEDMLVVTRDGYNDFTCSDKNLLIV